MKTSKVRLGWALGHDGVMRHIREVNRGKMCECVCPDCNAPLIARQGDHTEWHFAHTAESTCSGESALHRTAKQALVQAALENCQIRLPSAQGYVGATDIATIRHREDWSLEEEFLTLISGSEEKHITPSLISDVVVEDMNRKKTAVEIFVTHAKGDEEKKKYEESQFDAIEIDLSDLPWDADRQLIRKSILSQAPRQWLWSERAVQLRNDATHRLHKTIKHINQKKLSSFQAAVDRYRTIGLIESERLRPVRWQELNRTKTGRNAFNEDVFESDSETPKVTALQDDWKMRFPGAWQVTGIVNNKTPCDVIFLLPGVSTESLTIKRPSLFVAIDPDYAAESTKSEPNHLAVEWHGIGRWWKALDQRASKKLQKRIEESSVRKARYDSFTEGFRALGDNEKLAVLCKKLNMEPPTWAGKRVQCWNTTWSVWKTAVWLYKILRCEGGIIHLPDVAEDNWLRELFGFSNDPMDVAARGKQLWFWARELEKLDLMFHDGSQWFHISPFLPREFRPWERIRNNY